MRQASYSFMKLNGNSISSSLLYSGKLDGAQGPEYTLDYKKSMISLASTITNYSLTYKNNEDTIIMTFDTIQTGENYHLEIIVHKGESTIVKITTNKREPVTYEGNIR